VVYRSNRPKVFAHKTPTTLTNPMTNGELRFTGVNGVCCPTSMTTVVLVALTLSARLRGRRWPDVMNWDAVICPLTP